jgi:heptosyltransferase-2
VRSPQRILVFQTAFTGDVVLTLPLVQVLHRRYPEALIDMVVVPRAAVVLANHPAIHAVIPFDKKGKQKGMSAAFALARSLRQAAYDLAVIPHRSLRSAAVCRVARIARRIGFSTSTGRLLMTDVVRYRNDVHEVNRNLSLLQPLGISTEEQELPRLYPSADDTRAVDALLSAHPSVNSANMIAVAPGSVWATKRWLPERYGEACERLVEEGFSVALIGGRDDVSLGERIVSRLNGRGIVQAMGKLSVLQSAALLGKCRVAIANDSSPMHLAVAMRTPVVAIFGATVPEFGFAPLGKYDEIVQTHGLACRPCAIHGGETCPISTFVCMKNIKTEDVLTRVHAVLSNVQAVIA